jgi:hypothetical protein
MELDELVDESFESLVIKVYKESDSFSVDQYTCDGVSYVVFYHKILHNHDPAGLISRCRILASLTEYIVYILMHEVERGSISESPVVTLQDVCNRYSPFSTDYKFCPGIELNKYEMYHQKICFDLKSVRKMDFPVHRVDSKLCPLWFKLGLTASAQKKHMSEVQCSHCVRLLSDLSRQVQRKEADSPERKMKRQKPSSKARLSYMSPSSRDKRDHNAKVERSTYQRKFKRFEKTTIPLDDQQDEEVMSAMNIIERDHSDELEKLFVEGERHGVGQRLRELWNDDKQASINQFTSEQSRNSKEI